MNGKVTYRQQVSFCGKPGCRKCREGIGHGPYWYAYQTVDGRTVRTYIGKQLPPDVRDSEESSPSEVTPFENLLNQAHAASDPEERERLLEEALALYGREVILAETVSSQAEREALRHKWIGLLLELADLRIARSALSSAIDVLDRLLAMDPANEAAVQRLMITLAQLKRRGEALRAYQRFASTLQAGYQMVPSPETQALFESIQKGIVPSSASVYSRGDPCGRPGSADRPDSAGRPGSAPMYPQELPTSDTTRQPRNVEIGRHHQSWLVGRDAELETLYQLLVAAEASAHVRPANQETVSVLTNRALETPHPQCMMLMGEAGIGKTRLAEETAREAQGRGWAVVWSSAYAQESGVPYRLWIEAIRRVIAQGLWQGRDTQSRLQTYQPLKALLPELHELLPNSSYFAPLSPEQEQLRLREAIYELLTFISTSRPLLIVLDDVQWADGSSCELLGYLARRLPGHPVLLLGTCRETEIQATSPLRSLLDHMLREHAVELLHIKPLTDAQIGTLIASLPEAVVRHIQAQVAGNPFFAEELAYSFLTKHAELAPLHSAEPEHHGMDEVQPELPGTITAALDARLNRLSNSCQQLLGKAAVLGGSFGLQLITALEGSTDEDSVLDLLEEALQSGVLAEEGTGIRITYHFWHPLLASHLYNRLSATRRTRLHRRTAEVLQQMYAAREDEIAAPLVPHLVKGGAEAAHIARYAELAGHSAYALSAYPEAERYYHLAIRHLKVDSNPNEQLHLAFLLERLAECTRIQGRFQEARLLFERVMEVRSAQRTFMSPDAAEQEAQIQALLWSEIGWTWRYTGDNEQALECCERGRHVLLDAGIAMGPAWARLRYQQASLYWQQGKYEEGRRAVQEALRLFEQSSQQQHPTEDPARLTRTRRTLLGDPVDLGRAHALLGAIANATGQRTEALEHMSTALAIYESHDRSREIAHVCCNIGNVYLKKAEYTPAHTFLQRSLHLAERIGDIPLMSVVFHNLGELATYSGNLTEAEVLCRRSLVLAEQVHDREYQSLWNADLATILQEQGKLEEAKVSVCRALKIGRVIHNAPCIGLALVALGTVRIAQARAVRDEESGGERIASRFLMRARASLEQALALQGLEVETRTRGYLALAHALFLLGKVEVARREAVRAMEETRRYELMGLVAQCKRLLEEIPVQKM